MEIKEELEIDCEEMPRKKAEPVLKEFTNEEKDILSMQAILRKHGITGKPELIYDLLFHKNEVETSNLEDCSRMEINIKNFELMSQFYVYKSLNSIDSNLHQENDAFNDISKQLDWVRAQPQPVQRSTEWYEFRHTLITASDVYKIFKNYERKKLITKKAQLKPDTSAWKPPAACLIGIKYEEVATRIYAARNSTTIEEYGCIRHPTIPCVGASPDGISSEANEEFAGRMLEIKCPYSREITGHPPFHYWIQVQVQLEVCNLEKCDFLECTIKELDSEEEFFNGGFAAKGEKEHGIIITYSEDDKDKFIYSPIATTDEERESLKVWLDLELNKEYLKSKAAMNEYDSDDESVKVSYWYLEVYSQTLIHRSHEWWKFFGHPWIVEFWGEVQAEKSKLISGTVTSEVKKKPAAVCMIMSDDEI